MDALQTHPPHSVTDALKTNHSKREDLQRREQQKRSRDGEGQEEEREGQGEDRRKDGEEAQE